MTDQTINSKEMRQAFVEYDRNVILNNVKVGCFIGIIFMPVGSLLDYYVYKEDVIYFLKLRLLCSVLIGIFWTVIVTPFGSRRPRALGVLLAMFPSFFISWMIYATTGSDSPYYAGLNVVLLVIGFVLHWTLTESLVAVCAVLFMYVVACELNGDVTPVNMISNLYFLILTGIIVVIGSYVHSRWRLREFALRFELDRNKQVLEKQKLDLETALKQLKEAEAELVQNEKLASIGRLGAGIMHEINNPLNYATTGLYTLRKQAKFIVPEQQAAYNETLTDVEEGVKRVSAIVSDLRSFAHHDNESVEEVPAVDIITSALRFMSHEWNEANVKVEHNIPSGQRLAVNKNKLIQVCVNLLQNSLDALKEKHFTDGEQPTITIIGRVENGLSLLVFRDNGPGIKPEHLDKIFDPFFTTKDVGEGMGMGLSISYRIVAEYQGRIRVNTEPGRYCEFTLEFPVKG